MMSTTAGGLLFVSFAFDVDVCEECLALVPSGSPRFD